MTEARQPQLVIVAGPNGAGKSTLAHRLVPKRFGITHYVNADAIAQGLSFQPEGVAIDAGRIMLDRLEELSSRRVDFAFETTLSGRTYAQWMHRLRESGYTLHLLFIALSSPDLAVQRVASRIRLGGHSIPESVIRRRFDLGLRNFFLLYMPLVDTWILYDNSRGRRQNLVATGQRQRKPTVIELSGWQELRRYANVND